MNDTSAFQKAALQEQSPANSHTLVPLWQPYTSKPFASRRVCFYKSGDAQFSGLPVVINNRTFKTFEALLDSLSKRVPLPFGVRTITTPRGHTAIQGLDQLQHGQSYICSDKRTVKPIDLEQARRKPPPWYHARPVTSKRPRERQSPLMRNLRRNEHAALLHTPKRLVVFRNGDPEVKHTLLLQKRTTHSFEALLDHISEVMCFPVRRLHTPDGKRVDGLPALILCSGVLVAAGREPFRKGNYDVQKPFAPTWLPAKTVGRLHPITKRYLVNQLHNSFAESAYDPTGSVEMETCHQLESVAETDTVTCMDGDPNEYICMPKDDDIEKTFRVNQDGSMTVEMKVRLTIKEEETVHWTTTVSRQSVINQMKSGLESQSNLDAALSDKITPDVASAIQRSPEEYNNESTNEGLQAEEGFRTKEPMQQYPDQIFVESESQGTVQRLDNSMDDTSIEQVEDTSSEFNKHPVPKPRSSGISQLQASLYKSAEVLQLQDSGQETVLQIYEQQTCQKCFLANTEFYDQGIHTSDTVFSAYPDTIPSSDKESDHGLATLYGSLQRQENVFPSLTLQASSERNNSPEIKNKKSKMHIALNESSKKPAPRMLSIADTCKKRKKVRVIVKKSHIFHIMTDENKRKDNKFDILKEIKKLRGAIFSQAGVMRATNELCHSINSLREAAQHKQRSCLEKSNSLPDFSSHLASTFGSSSRVLLAFLSVMTLRDGLDNLNTLQEENSLSCSEALLMLQSLKEMAAIEDAEQLRANLNDLQKSTSDQLLQSWKCFQQLSNMCMSSSVTPECTQGGSYNASSSEEEAIQGLMEELGVPDIVREELAALHTQGKEKEPGRSKESLTTCEEEKSSIDEYSCDEEHMNFSEDQVSDSRIEPQAKWQSKGLLNQDHTQFYSKTEHVKNTAESEPQTTLIAVCLEHETGHRSEKMEQQVVVEVPEGNTVQKEYSPNEAALCERKTVQAKKKNSSVAKLISNLETCTQRPSSKPEKPARRFVGHTEVSDPDNLNNVSLTDKLIDTNSETNSSSLAFSYDSQSSSVAQDSERSVQAHRVKFIRDMFLAKSQTRTQNGQRQLHSPNSDLSDPQPESTDSGGNWSQETSSGEDDASRLAIAKGFVRRTIERLYGRSNSSSVSADNMRSPTALKAKQREGPGRTNVSSLASYHEARTRVMTDLSYFSATNASDIFSVATDCATLIEEVQSGDANLIDKGHWLLAENQLCECSPELKEGHRNENNKSISAEPEQHCGQEDSLHGTQHSTNLEKSGSTFTYFNLPNASDSDLETEEKREVKVAPATQVQKTRAERNSFLPAFCPPVLKKADNKVHPLTDSTTPTVVTQPVKAQHAQTGLIKQSAEPDALEMLFVFCGQHCPIL
ncbi:hypothetical protein Q7C36_004810 [Tachysurus vachellii]|uniref:Doublecortin domain-containing protein n=1 Tax=Tachysurus vachellii TaxID=175792 RepID=A0AA88TBK1_TACVA|nr:hypothetical protein Q7C36_004810 [Tachysurus vachellii]